MNLVLLIPTILGLASVLQTGINREIGAQHGFITAVIFNAFFIVATAVAVNFFVQKFGDDEFARTLRWDWPGKAFRWWYVIPGALGFFIVAGLPYATARIGATKSFVALIAAQLAGSLCWDAVVEGQGVSLMRVVGVVVAFAGALLTFLKR